VIPQIQLTLGEADEGKPPVGTVRNGVELGKTRSGSHVGFRRIAEQPEPLGEFRYVNSTPFGTVRLVQPELRESYFY